ERRESSGLVGGISREITALSAQQASEARSCTQKYLTEIVNIILRDEPASPSLRPSRDNKSHETVLSDPESYWGGLGIWEDNKNYCSQLVQFLEASLNSRNFHYADNANRCLSIQLCRIRRNIRRDV